MKQVIGFNGGMKCCIIRSTEFVNSIPFLDLESDKFEYEAL